MTTLDPLLSFWVPIASLGITVLALFVGPRITAAAMKRQAENMLKVAALQSETTLKVAAEQSATSLKIANKQIVAPMRQKWIDALRDRVAEIVSVSSWFYRMNILAVDMAESDPRKHDQTMRLVFLIQQIELMLNPNEADHNELLSRLENVRTSAWEKSKYGEFAVAVKHVNECCKKILKDEWKRVKAES